MDPAKKSTNTSRRKKIATNIINPRQIDFSNQSQPIPNQIQQFAQYQNQQFLNPNLQFVNPNQQFVNPNQQFLNSNPQFLSPNSYSHPAYNFSPTPQSTPHNNMFTYSSSQYGSEDQYPEYSPLHSLQNDPPSGDEVDVAEVAGGRKDSSKPFTREEDECLARAFVTGTENAENGRDQTTQIYWNDITRLYNEEGVVLGLPERQFKSLQNRLRRLKHEVMTYIEAEKFVSARHHSGWNQVMLNDAINAQFQLRNTRYSKLPFKCGHVLGILRSCSKFNAVTTRDAIPRRSSQDTENSPTTPNIGSNGSPEQSHEYHSGEKRSRISGDEVSSPLKHSDRPIGNKAAKKAGKGKGKVGESSEMSRLEHLQLSEKRSYFLDEALSHKKQAHADRMKIFQESLEVKALAEKNIARRLAVEEQKLELRRQEIQSAREMKILEQDLNSIECPVERAATKRMQQRIMSKWDL